jgi:hypothetical protein
VGIGVSLPSGSAPGAVAGFGLPQVAPGALFVYGVVELWGTVIEHDLAWRGQIARPVALLDHPSLDPAYRCARYASWEDLVRDWSI